MRAVRLYIDEDSMNRALVRALRSRNIDVVTALEFGMISKADLDHLTLATTEGRVLFTYNVGDYYLLHTAFLTEGNSHAGMILARQQHYSFGEQMRRLLKLVATRSAEEMRDRAEFLSSWG